MELTKRQKQIIDVALELIAQGGIQNLTVKNIANAIGVTEPAVYRHYQSKADIIKTMICSFDDAVSVNDGNLQGIDAIIGFTRNRIQQVINKPALARVMFAE